MTKTLFGILLLLKLCNPSTNLFAQERLVDGYDIITKTIRHDTVLDQVVGYVFHKEILKGNQTKQDSIDYIAKIKKKHLILVNRQRNIEAREILAKAYLDSSSIAQVLGKECLLNIVNRIGKDTSHPDFLQGLGIEIIENNDKVRPNHTFSKPFLVEDNRYLIYHHKYIGRGSGLIEFILYTVSPGFEIEIERNFELWNHGG